MSGVLSAVLGVLAAAEAASPTEAADGGGDVIGTVLVTSSRDKENPTRPIASLQDIPTSTSVVTGIELDRLSALRLGDITERAANVSWNLGNSRTSSLSIRGIGKQAQTDAMDPSVGITVDGVAYAYNPLASFDFFDLQEVDVARGPQGTQGGKNANLGLLNIVTRQPTFGEQDTQFSLTYGDYRTVMARAATGGTIIDNLLAWRASVAVDKGDGAYKNAYNTDLSYPNMDNVAARAQFLLTPFENFKATLRLDSEPRHNEFYNGWVLYTPTPTHYANGAVNTLSTDASTRLARAWFTQEANYSYLANYLGNSPTLDNQTALVTSSKGGSLELDWNIGKHTLTSVTAYKDYQFQARNDEGTPFDISKNGGGHVFYSQSSEELRLTSPTGGFLDYTAGLYLLRSGNNYDSGSGFGSDAGAWFATPAQYTTLNADGNGRFLLSESLNRLNFKPLQQIDNRTVAVYGQANWHFTDAFTVLTGARATHEDRTNLVSKLIYDNGYAAELNPASINGVQLGTYSNDAIAQKYFGVGSYSALNATQLAELAAAKAIRASQLGVLWNPTDGPRFRKTQPEWVVSPSYKFGDDVTAYISYRHGEKAGISQVVNGVPFLAEPEKSDAYELGVKTFLLNHTLVFDADVFVDNIKNYQQQVQVFDAYTTALRHDGTNYYTAATGNAPKVRSSGVELDSVWTPIANLSLRLSGAYDSAVYKDFPNLGQPLENANLATPYRNVTGQALPGAAKWTGNAGVDFRQPVFANAVIHASANYFYTSRYNSDVSLSSYAWVHGYGIADLSVGIGRADEKFDLSVLAKNVFNNLTSQVVLWNSYVPAVPRWVGVQFSARF
jgi:iron complex outermembrane recepter protein